MPIRKKKKTAKRRTVSKVKRVRRRVTAKPKKRKVVSKKRKSHKRKRLVKHVASHVVGSVGRVKRRTKTKTGRPRKRRVVMAGRRNRSVGKKGNMGLLLGLGIGALAIYLFTKPKTTAYPTYSQLPPLIPTTNYQRNDQQNSILQYALAASLGIDAITKLIASLNNSSDGQVQNIYDHVETTGTLPDTVYV